ncbi:hypothetical protein GGR38_002479 [Novosphingobium sediminicola]|uniref:Uncharacterized protein n=1 Tax=Novosphingobium sediminicola TaxID=563162 RepID=A0A7W6G6V1_9SPHN|nr:hypothetical protein [Novosphingobium sediminicola]
MKLLRDIRGAQEKLVILADATPAEGHSVPLPLDAFMASLRTLWQGSEARPTAKEKQPQKRGRRRPDPLVEVTDPLRVWFEDDPGKIGRELLERLQREQPGDYPSGLLRTVQRRLKGWRSENAWSLVFGDEPDPTGHAMIAKPNGEDLTSAA